MNYIAFSFLEGKQFKNLLLFNALGTFLLHGWCAKIRPRNFNARPPNRRKFFILAVQFTQSGSVHFHEAGRGWFDHACGVVADLKNRKPTLYQSICMETEDAIDASEAVRIGKGLTRVSLT